MHVATEQPLAVELEVELTFLQSLVGIVQRLPLPAVPDHDAAGAVLALVERERVKSPALIVIGEVTAERFERRRYRAILGELRGEMLKMARYEAYATPTMRFNKVV